MTKPRDPDALLSAFLAEGMSVLPDRVVDFVLDEIHRTHQRSVFGPWRIRSMSRTAFGAAAVVAALALIGAFYVIQRSQSTVAGPSPTPTVRPSQSQPAVVGPSATPTARPLTWSQASLDEDWPAPVRSEPDAGAIVRPFVHGAGGSPQLFEEGLYPDPSGDTGSAVHPWVDIRQLEGSGRDCLSNSSRTSRRS